MQGRAATSVGASLFLTRGEWSDFLLQCQRLFAYWLEVANQVSTRRKCVGLVHEIRAFSGRLNELRLVGTGSGPA